MTTTLKIGAMSALMLAGLAACAPQKIMLGDTFFPDTNKVARESLKISSDQGNSGTGGTGLTNFYIQVCDVNGNDQTNCQTTLVLENITDYVIRQRF